MENSLERVLTVHQTSMGSTRLPLELQQQVFSFLDTKSFHAARNVCKWWRYASVDAVTLSRQLRKLPILPIVDAAKNTPRELHDLFGEAAYTLMLGTQIRRQPDQIGSMSIAQRNGCLSGPKVTATTNGNRTVTINGRTIALFDTSGHKPKVLAQRPINDLEETVGSGPWLKVTPTSYHEMALSPNGRILAIAQERTIQIYDLMAEPDSFTVNEYISSAAGHYICGLAFEQDDHVLRVQLSGKGTVLYLGTPPSHKTSSATIEHWKSKAGLKHVFMDTSLLALTSESASPDQDHTSRLSGAQLLRPFASGYLFAAQRHGGNESSHYILGHIACSPSTPTHPLTAEPHRVTILARLESFLSAWHYHLNGVQESGAGLWENMPSAHEHHPTFALSPNGNVLVLAERDKKRIRPVSLTQVFVYRLPSERRLRKILGEEEGKRRGRWARLDGVLRRLEGAGDGGMEVVGGGKEEEKRHTVGRIPQCLSTVQGAVTSIEFEALEGGGGEGWMLSVETAEATKRWALTEML